MRDIISSQAFGIMLTLFFYLLANFFYQKTKFPLFNPLLISTLLLMGFVKIADLDINTFLTDLSGINVFLGPLIVSLAIPIAKQIDLIKKNWLVILVGSFVGSVVSILTVVIIGPMLGLDKEIIASLIPKSATTPIAIEVSNLLGGIRAITVAVVILSAVIGTIVIPMIVKMMKISDPIIIGMTLGTTSQAVGTAKAIEIHPEAGAISGIALVVTGVFTALISLFL
jgi:predicted murein hydrolase (TIGR00659 family)